MIRGNLDRLHFGDLLHWLELGGHTGRLTLTDDTGERRLDLLHGRVVYISSTIPEERLATWLTRDGLLPAHEVRRLLASGMLRHELFTDVLIETGAVNATELGASLTVLAELMIGRILKANELRFEFDPGHPIRDRSGLYLKLAPNRLLLDSARRVDESGNGALVPRSRVLPLDEAAVDDFFWQLVRLGIDSNDRVDGSQLAALHDIVRNVMASLSQWLASSTGLVPQPADQGEVMAANLETRGEVRLFGLPQTVWNLMVLACSIRSSKIKPPTGLDDLDSFAASLDLWPEITRAVKWQRSRAGALDPLTRRVSIVWSRGASAAAAELGVDPGAAALAAHLVTVPTDLVLWVLAALPVPHKGVRHTLLIELPHRIAVGLGHLADFPPDIQLLFQRTEPSLLGVCLHVSRNLVPSASAWPTTIPEDESALFDLVTPTKLQRATVAATRAIEGATLEVVDDGESL